ncbi:helix-turn-helix domain-containing protein [uncultured Sphingobacterium sp.]|uniref:AlbA family DNA-binding domain-containing protein n=1 Tax=uncultured Sphingobacterium sp. TaxID=182688 RepID=UPI003747D245
MNNLCNEIFGKPLLELVIEDIREYFVEDREETDNLEFKSGQIAKKEFMDVLESSITKVASSFLNSTGGVIIWGAPQMKKNNGKLICQGDLTPCFKADKDLLINKIIQKVSYMPTGISIKPINLSETECIYIIEVAESENKPHQWNNSYYIRLDGQSKPAPHYLVDALFKSVKFPNVVGGIRFNNISYNGKYYILNFDTLIFNLSPLISEKNLRYNVINSGGLFRDDSSRFDSSLFEQLHFGKPLRRQFSLKLNINDLAAMDNKFTVGLIWGGDLAPSKSSSYNIDLTEIEIGTFNFERYIGKNYYESRSFYERQMEKGIDMFTQFQEILGH